MWKFWSLYANHLWVYTTISKDNSRMFWTQILLILSVWIPIFLIPLAQQEYFCCKDSRYRNDEVLSASPSAGSLAAHTLRWLFPWWITGMIKNGLNFLLCCTPWFDGDLSTLKTQQSLWLFLQGGLWYEPGVSSKLLWICKSKGLPGGRICWEQAVSWKAAAVGRERC